MLVINIMFSLDNNVQISIDIKKKQGYKKLIVNLL